MTLEYLLVSRFRIEQHHDEQVLEATTEVLDELIL